MCIALAPILAIKVVIGTIIKKAGTFIKPTLKGKFTFAGNPGAPKALVVDKDTAVCSKDGMQLFERSLIVDEASKGLANVVVFLRKSSRVKNESATEKLVMDQKNCEFLKTQKTL